MFFLKQVFLAALIMLFCTTPKTTYAVSEKTSTYSQIGGGLAAGAVAGVISNLAVKNPLVTTLASLGVSGLSWFILHHYLSKLTPTSRINAATKIMQWVESDSFLSQNFATMEEFITYINARFGSDNSLTAARKQLEKLLDGCQEARSLAKQALQDARGNDAKTTCENFLCRTSSFIQALEVASRWIRIRDFAINLCNIERRFEIDLCKIEEDQIFSHDFTTDEDLINYVTASFGTTWPLILGYNHAIDLKKALEDFLLRVDQFSRDALEYNSPRCTVMCKEFSTRIQLLLNALPNKISLISTQKDYKFQDLLYKNNQLTEEVQSLGGQCSSLDSQLSDMQRQVSSLQCQVQQQEIMQWQLQFQSSLQRYNHP